MDFIIKNVIRSHINILELPPEMITEIIHYLPWCDVKDACLVCKLWLKIGQKEKYVATKRGIRDITLNAAHHETDNPKLKLGKSHFMSRKTDKVLEKLCQTFTRPADPGNLGVDLSEKVYKSSSFQEIIRRKFKHGMLHGLTHKLTEHFLHKSKKKTTETCFMAECDINSGDIFSDDERLRQQSMQVAIPNSNDIFRFLLN